MTQSYNELSDRHFQLAESLLTHADQMGLEANDANRISAAANLANAHTNLAIAYRHLFFNSGTGKESGVSSSED